MRNFKLKRKETLTEEPRRKTKIKRCNGREEGRTEDGQNETEGKVEDGKTAKEKRE